MHESVSELNHHNTYGSHMMDFNNASLVNPTGHANAGLNGAASGAFPVIPTAAKFIVPLDSLDQAESQLERLMARPNSSLQLLSPLPYSALTPGLVEREVVRQGKPLYIQGVCKNWNRDLFSYQWLREHFGDWEMINSPRDLTSMVDLVGWTVGDYIDYCVGESPTSGRLLYGKDISCPEQWRTYLASRLASYFCYEHRDLVSHLEKEQQPETLMVYVGVNNTYTPCHTDICGSIGHNLMVSGDEGAYAIWLIAAAQDKAKAAALFGQHGATLEADNCFLPLEKLAEADFPFYVIKQRRGDFIIVPPESAHQVLNKGGMSIKIAWNRVTPSTVSQTYRTVLPYYHEICKAEVYRIKALVYYGLTHRIHQILERGDYEERYLIDLPPLVQLFEEIVYEEWIAPAVMQEARVVNLEKKKFRDRIPHLRTCNFCNMDIFNRCYRCPVCVDDYDICLGCIAEGRGCKHNEQLELMEHISVNKLKDVLEQGYLAYHRLAVHFGSKTTELGRADLAGKNSMASLAFQMVWRYRDCTEYRCHQCKRRKKHQYMVDCWQDCGKSYCAMCLWNRYGVKQVYAQRHLDWQCPYCQKTCNCAACLRKRGLDPRQHEVLADYNALYKALLAISVVVPPAFARNADAVAGVCDSAPKPARSQGYSIAEMEKAKTARGGRLDDPFPFAYYDGGDSPAHSHNGHGSSYGSQQQMAAQSNAIAYNQQPPSNANANASKAKPAANRRGRANQAKETANSLDATQLSRAANSNNTNSRAAASNSRSRASRGDDYSHEWHDSDGDEDDEDYGVKKDESDTKQRKRGRSTKQRAQSTGGRPKKQTAREKIERDEDSDEDFGGAYESYRTSERSQAQQRESDSDSSDGAYQGSGYGAAYGSSAASGVKRRKRAQSETTTAKVTLKPFAAKRETSSQSDSKKTSPNNTNGGSGNGDKSPSSAVRSDHYIPNDYIPMDYQSSVLTFSHPGITYEEYIRVYNERTRRDRKVNGREKDKASLYWCFCGLLRTTAQHFASHAKVCPVYKVCTNPAREAHDPIFRLETGLPEPKILSDSEDEEYDENGVVVRGVDDAKESDLNLNDESNNAWWL